MSDYNVYWEGELYTKYPHAMSNCYCGAEYPFRWHEAVKKALEVIEQTNCTVSQIKSKWGLLRLYIDAPRTREGQQDIDAVNSAIQTAEREVFYIEKALGSKYAVGEWD